MDRDSIHMKNTDGEQTAQYQGIEEKTDSTNRPIKMKSAPQP